MSKARAWLDERRKFYRRPLNECWAEDFNAAFERKPFSLYSVTAFAAARIGHQLSTLQCNKGVTFEPADEHETVLYRLHMDWITSGAVVVTQFNGLKLIVMDKDFTTAGGSLCFNDYLITADKFPTAVWTRHPLHPSIGNVIRPRLTGVLGQFDCRYVNRARPRFKDYGISTATKKQIKQYLSAEQFLPLGQIFEYAWFPKVLSAQPWRNDRESTYLYYALVDITLNLCLLGVDEKYHKFVRKKVRSSLQNLRKKHGDQFAEELLELDAIKPSAV